VSQPHAASAAGSNLSAGKAWLRALERTAPIAGAPRRVLPVVVEELAAAFGEATALLSSGESLSYAALAARSNKYARWALAQGIAKGDAVCLLMPNRPEYMAIWLGIASVGGIVSLLNTNLSGPSLAHCINIVAPKRIIASSEFAGTVAAALPESAAVGKIWAHGAGCDQFPRIDLDVENRAGEPLDGPERRPLTIEDRALFIYTSGTTGLPKAANVSHFRLMQWSHWFAGMMDVRPGDRMYNCLPMYHSVGGVLATGAVLVGGGMVAIREKFAARDFWSDVVRFDCTLVQYIGELCRYLVQSEPSVHEGRHRVRLFCGNGLRPDVWDAFKARFRIPRIFEFYASTEGNVSLFNIEGRPGAIGRSPRYLAHRSSVELVKFDAGKEAPLRGGQGLCIRCATDEVGEALGRISAGSADIGSRFEGYTSTEASNEKILRNVFERGDAWFRTGDLMRRDAEGYYYFIDRTGDTYRWKGENVSAAEVSEAICAFPGVREATAYGVPVPGTEGKAGMVALAGSGALDLAALRDHLVARLPAYARPLFLRLRNEIDVTGTFKYAKADLVRLGYDPVRTADPIFFNDPERQEFVLLDQACYERIQTGKVRL
jgi:fatty-acyl-CoA synthase